MGERPVITRHDDEVLVASVGDVELFTYVHRPSTPAFEGPKPYLHPVRTLAGDVVTAFRPHDHRWHKGVQMTATDVSGENFWGGVTYVRDQGYVALPNVGSMRHDEFTSTDSGNNLSPCRTSRVESVITTLAGSPSVAMGPEPGR